MTINSKRVLVICVIVGMVLVIAALWIYSSVEALLACSVDVRHTLPAPNGKLVIVTFGTDCGATTPMNTQVSIVPSDHVFSNKDYPAVFIVRGQQNLMIRWVTNNLVEIHVPKNAEIYRRVKRIDGISIAYKRGIR